MTYDEVTAIVARITYKPNWMLCLKKNTEDSWLMWASFETTDSMTGDLVSLETRCWLVDSTFDEEAVVGAAFLCIQQAETHEFLEFFKVDGYSIHNPHITISARKAAVRASFDAESLASMGLA